MTKKKQTKTERMKHDIKFYMFLAVVATIAVSGVISVKNHTDSKDDMCNIMANKIYGKEYECKYYTNLLCSCEEKVYIDGGYYLDHLRKFTPGELYD